MAEDDSRAMTVLFGGLTSAGPSDDTWVWDAAGWTQRFPATVPPARHGHSMAFDSLRGVFVLFGGSPGSLTTWLPDLADLWEYNGTTWTQRSFQTGPSGRKDAAMTFDRVRGRVVMFGGTSNGSVIQQADAHWEWDGNAWTRHSFVPPARTTANLVYDRNRNRTVLFGGLGTCQSSCPTFGDTWEFDGASWTQRSVAGPPARFGASAAYDIVRGVIVLSGGQGLCYPGCTYCLPACLSLYNDTWEWNGTVWTPRPAVAPLLHNAVMTYDAARGSCIVFGGMDRVFLIEAWLSAETYLLNGTTWASVAPSPMPPARNSDAAAFDPVRREVIWFGSTTSAIPGVSGTFAFNGAQWRRLTTPVAPAARSGHALVADRGRRRVVLFGGRAPNNTVLGDTWEWDGVQWAQRAPLASPPAQENHGLAYDTRRGVVVLYPGALGRGELHEYNGITWTLRTFPSMPQLREIPAFAYDEARGNCVLLGRSLPQLSHDCWLYDGVQWVQDLSAVRPPVRLWSRMVFDAARGRMVLFGGSPGGSAALQDTWEWDGSNWLQRTDVGTPPARMSQAMAYDEARGRIVMFGGRSDNFGFNYLHDTWELVNGCESAGPGEVGGGGMPMSCDREPTRGQTFCLDYQNASPNASGLNFLLLTLGSCSTSPLVVPSPTSCVPSFLYGLPSEIHFQLGTRASFCFAVPNQPVFLGAVLCFQGSALETTGCLRATDGVTAVVR